MTDTRFTSETARVAAQVSIARRREKRVDITRLPPLDSHERCRAAYELVLGWTCDGLLNGTTGGAAVRAIDGARALLPDPITFEAVEALRADLAAVVAERDNLAHEVERLRRRTA